MDTDYDLGGSPDVRNNEERTVAVRRIALGKESSASEESLNLESEKGFSPWRRLWLRLRRCHPRLTEAVVTAAGSAALRELHKHTNNEVIPLLQLLCILGSQPARLVSTPVRSLVAPFRLLARPLLVLGVAAPILQKLKWGKHKDKPDKEPANALATRRSWRLIGRNTSTTQRVRVFTPQEASDIAELKAALGQERLTIPDRVNEGEILRFLKMTAGDKKRAIYFLKAHIKWREEVKFLSKQELHAVSKIIFWHQKDKDGRPCLIIRVNKALPLIRRNRVWIPRIIAAILTHIELAMVHRLKDGEAEQVAVVLDAEGVGIASIPVNMIKSIILCMARNYPMRLGVFYLVRAPPSVNFILAALRSALPPTNRHKIKVAGKNVAHELFNQFDESQLIRLLGGSCQCQMCEEETYDEPLDPNAAWESESEDGDSGHAFAVSATLASSSWLGGSRKDLRSSTAGSDHGGIQRGEHGSRRFESGSLAESPNENSSMRYVGVVRMISPLDWPARYVVTVFLFFVIVAGTAMAWMNEAAPGFQQSQMGLFE